MPHNIVNGFCESGCKVPVKPAAQVEDLKHGGTGAEDAAGARDNLDVYSREEVRAYVAQEIGKFTDAEGVEF